MRVGWYLYESGSVILQYVYIRDVDINPDLSHVYVGVGIYYCAVYLFVISIYESGNLLSHYIYMQDEDPDVSYF